MGIHEVAIVGTGFGGLGLAITLRKAGVRDVILLEKGSDVGGVWRENTYPGAACDIPSHLYSFSFEPNPDWSRRYSPQSEILEYLRGCARKHDLVPSIRFGTEVTGATWIEDGGFWRIATSRGESIDAHVLVSARGQLSRPKLPAIAGLDTFEGVAFHSAAWDHGCDLRGKRVAVLGTGASAIQFVPRIADEVGRLHLFQRSAPYVIPKPDRTYTSAEKWAYRRLPWLLMLSRLLVYLNFESRFPAFTSMRWVMRLVRWQFDRQLKEQVADPALRAKLLPDYPMGCKRVLGAEDYYPALARPNVEVVTDRVARIEPRGVVTQDGTLREVDAIIFGTGFDSTDFLASIELVGREGKTLRERFAAGAEAYLGLMVDGFPNFFMLYGPNTNLGHNSIIYMLESQFAYVERALALLRAQGRTTIEVRAEVLRTFNEQLQRELAGSVWADGCTSWYKTDDGRNTCNWSGPTYVYRRRTRALVPEEYRLT